MSDIDSHIDLTQFDHDRPAKVASDWVDAVLRQHDLAAGWPLMAEGLRRKAVRAWIDANLSHPALKGEDPDALCEALTQEQPTGHPLWGGYAVTQVREFCKGFDHLTLDHCGFASGPRPLALDVELILFVDTGSPEPAIVDVPPGVGVELPGVGFVMRYAGACRLRTFSLVRPMRNDRKRLVNGRGAPAKAPSDPRIRPRR